MVKQFNFNYEELSGEGELSGADRDLFERAKAIAAQAYAPYSKFFVGCALLLENGTIITGNNQENAAYPLGLCAERVAFFHAGANYKGVKIIKAAIYARSELFTVTEAVSPCGACRQAMSEYEQNQGSTIQLIMGGEKGPIIKTSSVSILLPLIFSKISLHMD